MLRQCYHPSQFHKSTRSSRTEETPPKYSLRLLKLACYVYLWPRVALFCANTKNHKLAVAAARLAQALVGLIEKTDSQHFYKTRQRQDKTKFFYFNAVTSIICTHCNIWKTEEY